MPAELAVQLSVAACSGVCTWVVVAVPDGDERFKPRSHFRWALCLAPHHVNMLPGYL